MSQTAVYQTASLPAGDPTPEEWRSPLLDAMLAHVPFDGWSKGALHAAASDLGLPAEMAELAFPDGAIEVLEMHLKKADADLTDTLAAMNLPAMKIRERITVAIRTRLEMHADHRESVRRGLATLSLPQHAGLAMRSLWATADTMWRAAGDTSTDHNWYTKRMTLSAVYSSVLLFWLNDDSEDFRDSWAFLDRRIENVMQIEKAKFRLRQTQDRLPSVSRFLGRLRYHGL